MEYMERKLVANRSMIINTPLAIAHQDMLENAVQIAIIDLDSRLQTKSTFASETTFVLIPGVRLATDSAATLAAARHFYKYLVPSVPPVPPVRATLRCCRVQKSRLQLGVSS